MKLSEINDSNLQCYLAGSITLEELAAKVTGVEPFEIVDGKVITLTKEQYRNKITGGRYTKQETGKPVPCKPCQKAQEFKQLLASTKPPILYETADVPARKLAIVTVCRKGTKFSAVQVRWLLDQLVDHIKQPFRFICLTDDMSSPGAIPLKHDWPKWWAKMEVFRPDLYYDGETVMFLDLDTVITKDFVVPMAPHLGDLLMVRFGGCWFTKFGSGLMIFSAPFTKPYENFKANSAKIIECVPSDQEAILASVIQNGGNIIKAENAEVQKMCGTEYIPNECPQSAIFFTAGNGAKPWEIEKSWIPKTKPLITTVEDTALITVLYGSDPLRIKAARNGARKLSSLPQKPGARLLVELVTGSNETQCPEWTGDRLTIPVDDSYGDIWQKEVLMNLGAYHIFEKYPDVTKLVFTDLDVYPAEQWNTVWLNMTSKALDTYQVVQPWYKVSEDSIDDFSYRSYSWMKHAGAKSINSGQGFCIAITKSFFTAMGGFPENCLSGSGDSLTILRIDKDCAMSDIYIRTWNEWKKNIESYNGPKVEIGWLPCELKHSSHGKRDAKSDGYRCYHFRNYLWEFVGGVEAVIQKDRYGQLWQWKDTPLARAARAWKRRYKELQTIEDVYRIWNECLQVEGNRK